MRLPHRTALPWRAPRHELLLLALVAATALPIVLPVGAQDASHWCLSRALTHGRLYDDACFQATADRTKHAGHVYSDEAPGLGALGVPVVEALRLRPPARWPPLGDRRLWAVRVLTAGVAFLVCAFLVGRVAEGLVPGAGPFALVTFALGSLAAPLAAGSFDHLPAAAFCFGAFVLAWARRPFVAGLAGGLGIVTEYEAVAIVAALALYVALDGLRTLARFVAGASPGAVLLAAYDWAAFGAPWRASLGLHGPSAHAVRVVLVGDRGLLVVSPVLVAAAAGLLVLWRSGYAAEAAVCAAVTVLFALFDIGHIAPYGGDSPGPRYFAPALPFLMLGAPVAYARWREATALLAVVSVTASVAVMLTWPAAVNAREVYRWSVWGNLAGFAAHGAHSDLARWLGETVYSWAGLGRMAGAGIVAVTALVAFVLGLQKPEQLGATRERS